MNTKSTIRKNANNFLTHTKKERGITLIALVVTIIILLILAGVSLQIALGENGLFTYSRKAGEEHCHQAVKEALEMSATTYEMDKLANNGNKSLIEYLQEKEIIEDIGEEGNYQINVKTLVGSKMQLGNGSDKKDVYMLEENKGLAELGKYATIGEIKIAEASSGRKEYLIKYYVKSEEENIDLGKLVDSGTAESDTDYSQLLYEFFKGKGYEEVEKDNMIDGFTSKYLFNGESEDNYPDYLEYRGGMYRVDYDDSGDYIVKEVKKIPVDLSKFGVQQVDGKDVLITPSTQDHLVHTSFDTATQYWDDEKEDYQQFEGYVAYDADGYNRYYDNTGVLVCVMRARTVLII